MSPTFSQSLPGFHACAFTPNGTKNPPKNTRLRSFFTPRVNGNASANNSILMRFRLQTANFLLTWTMPGFNFESIEVFNLGSSRPSVDCALSSLGFFFLQARQQHQHRRQERHRHYHAHPHSDRHDNSKTLNALMFRHDQASKTSNRRERRHNHRFPSAAR